MFKPEFQVFQEKSSVFHKTTINIQCKIDKTWTQKKCCKFQIDTSWRAKVLLGHTNFLIAKSRKKTSDYYTIISSLQENHSEKTGFSLILIIQISLSVWDVETFCIPTHCSHPWNQTIFILQILYSIFETAIMPIVQKKYHKHP